MKLRGVFVLVGLVGCGTGLPFEPAGPDAAPDPAEYGPFPVGVRTVTIEDRDRIRPDGSARALVTEVWYPAVEDGRDGPGVRYPLEDFLTEELLAQANQSLPSLDTIAVRDAEPRSDLGPYPLVVFSHGNGGIRVQSTFFTVALASHGYVVVAPDHQGNTLADLATDGAADSADQAAADRPVDVQRLIDAFTDDPAGQIADDDPLAGLADPEWVGVSGHSFGGYTSFAAAFVDPRVDLVVPMAPPTIAMAGSLADRPASELGIPVLMECGGLDGTVPADLHCGTSYDALSSPRYLVTLPEAGHFTFSDICALDLAGLATDIGLDLGNVLEDGCGEGFIPAARAQPIMKHFGIAAMNLYLRSSSDSGVYLRPAAVAGFGDDVLVESDP